mmetsp:Transcript_80624/g.147027  ORF Transcript_80624/g.147027 Transcript_80624/m.147027 type:complete len:331 (-) Transcript_80624:84-1076(-)
MLHTLVEASINEGLGHPVASGLLLGFVMIGPDHLGTLMALSTLTSGVECLKVGILWGLGHSIGMVLIVPPFMLLQKFSTQAMHVKLDQWEYWGDYFIGASMIAVALYFWFFESKYLEKKADGTYTARSCACHGAHEDAHSDAGGADGHLPTSAHECPDETRKSQQPCRKHKFCASFSACQETTPLLNVKAATSSRLNVSWNARDMRSAFLGVFQGLCCPMALMGVGFMGKMSGTAVPSLITFVLVFLVASALGSGVLTLCWGMLSSHGLASCSSPLVVYRMANVFTFSLGVIWIAANATGVLHYVNYLEGVHHDAGMDDKVHEMHSGLPM